MTLNLSSPIVLKVVAHGHDQTANILSIDIPTATERLIDKIAIGKAAAASPVDTPSCVCPLPGPQRSHHRMGVVDAT